MSTFTLRVHVAKLKILAPMQWVGGANQRIQVKIKVRTRCNMAIREDLPCFQLFSTVQFLSDLFTYLL